MISGLLLAKWWLVVWWFFFYFILFLPRWDVFMSVKFENFSSLPSLLLRCNNFYDLQILMSSKGCVEIWNLFFIFSQKLIYSEIMFLQFWMIFAKNLCLVSYQIFHTKLSCVFFCDNFYFSSHQTFLCFSYIARLNENFTIFHFFIRSLFFKIIPNSLFIVFFHFTFIFS